MLFILLDMFVILKIGHVSVSSHSAIRSYRTEYDCADHARWNNTPTFRNSEIISESSGEMSSQMGCVMLRTVQLNSDLFFCISQQ